MPQRASRWRPERVSPAGVGLALALIVLGLASTAAGQPLALKTVAYHGYPVVIPASWPIYRLARTPGACVRFDRHALYLGLPSHQETCPANLAGRTEAILVAPDDHASAGPTGGGFGLAGSVTTFRVPSAGVVVTATWRTNPGLIERALGRLSLPIRRRSSASRRGWITGHEQPDSTAANSSVYTGRGFDACSAPSSSAMAAWSSSYHAIGIYIGGVNEACAQPNLTPDWVSQQIAAGWHLVPTYVGLQAPSNGCGCAGISPSQASAQGSAAGSDAVADMQALGLPTGNPIYYDMEGYDRTQANSQAVLSFLSGWTSQLHADGYVAGVYSSVASGMSDLASQWGTSYPEPDDIWFAEWNDQQGTSSSYVPAGDWSAHQRLHQYKGGHNETHDGVTINIDSDYLDGATAGTVGPPAPIPAPTLSVSPAADGTTLLRMSWPQGSGLAAWEVLGGPAPTSLVRLTRVRASGGASTQATVHGTDPYFEAEALGSGGQVLATSSAVPTPAHVITFGRSVFVSKVSGTGGLPVGCYTGSTCHLATTVKTGRTTIAQTGTEGVGANGVGILYFRLNGAGRNLLARSRSGAVPVKVAVRDKNGPSASAAFNLVGYLTSGRAPRRDTHPSSTLKVVGLTAYIAPQGVGGLLTACLSPAPCWVTARVSSSAGLLAHTGRELIGAGELGYVTFKLSGRGQGLLSRTVGNQLGVRTLLAHDGAEASADVVLTRF